MLRPPVHAFILFSFRQNRRRDQDNWTASLKAVWDGLVDSGLLLDDSADKLRIEPVDIVVGRRAGVIIRLTEAPPPALPSGGSRGVETGDWVEIREGVDVKR